jgi:hypothetical protein
LPFSMFRHRGIMLWTQRKTLNWKDSPMLRPGLQHITPSSDANRSQWPFNF